MTLIQIIYYLIRVLLQLSGFYEIVCGAIDTETNRSVLYGTHFS